MFVQHRLRAGPEAWKAGDAEFIGRGVKHESKNTGQKPVDVFILAIK